MCLCADFAQSFWKLSTWILAGCGIFQIKSGHLCKFFWTSSKTELGIRWKEEGGIWPKGVRINCPQTVVVAVWLDYSRQFSHSPTKKVDKLKKIMRGAAEMQWDQNPKSQGLGLSLEGAGEWLCLTQSQRRCLNLVVGTVGLYNVPEYTVQL